ncbi:MAG: hypothetical protein KC478_17155 [Bacteriovoracaceae bacterium]|nr:hypothetical protein [Bacteriovoracaceae bacterium]
MRATAIAALFLSISSYASQPQLEQTKASLTSSKVALGQALFSDQNLSLNRTMSCATCHNPDHGFIDNRYNVTDGAVSVGQDGHSLGDRNAPTVTYAKFTPAFYERNGFFFGGQFFDGRAADLVEQAKGPFLDGSEMQMPNAKAVVERVMENDEYVQAFKNIYGDKILNDSNKAFTAVADAIAQFEKSDSISPFDSKFDKGLLNEQERRGLKLFKGKAMCIKCHAVQSSRPLFTNFGYRNIGVPANTKVRQLNGKGIDNGLFKNPSVTDVRKKGKFRISGLRNIAVTAPYMHNGVFKELKTVVHFYNTRDVEGAINPETNMPWRAPEVTTEIITGNMGDLGLSDAEEDDIVAFLRTLTDSKYSHLD